ncbi:MAG: NADP-reducing hydrogenase subunit HndA [Dehalococcoidia bacterium]|nr:NADP-reducing hydrogenase subunit HndA [Chloroflexota bacterium]MBT9162658.1 NADP-reducing hydrogenase subunit HndA [Chloroflexota bacterium]
MEDRLTEIVSSSRGRKGDLIPILQRIQAEFGYLPEEAIVKVAGLTGVAESRVFGVASFYAQFRFTPMGRNRVMVCRGTACHVKGAPRILDEVEKAIEIKEGETRQDLEYTLESVTCIGCCGLAPCIMVNKEVHGRLIPKEIGDIFITRGECDAG